MSEHPAPTGELRLRRRWALTIAVLAAIAVLATVNAPGLTVDEPINVGHGKRLFYTLMHRPVGFLESETVDRLWRNGHEHPPLCRFLIGVAHGVFDGDPRDPGSIAPKLGRPIGALAFALIVFLCAEWAGRIAGFEAGIAAGLIAATMPRCFAHAHLASPETISSALFLAGLRSAWLPPEAAEGRIGGRRAIRSGTLAGLALLAKLTNILLLPVAGSYWLCMRGRRSVAPIVAFGLTAFVVFFCGWPWLWPFNLQGYSPGFSGSFERLREFFGVGLQRATVYAWYFGKQYPNPESGVPWHYAPFYFAATIPSMALGCGLIAASQMVDCKARARLSVALPLLATAVGVSFFMLPIDRYDGERIFLFVFGPFAAAAGVGCSTVARWVAGVAGRRLAAIVLLFICLFPVVDLFRLHPVQLSYYNALVNGLTGADRLGLEATYWGDSLTETFLDRFIDSVPPGEAVERITLLPTLYAGHAAYLPTARMLERKIAVQPGDRFAEHFTRYVVMFNRAGYLQDPLPRRIMEQGRVVAELSRDGVWLARVYQVDPSITAAIGR